MLPMMFHEIIIVDLLFSFCLNYLLSHFCFMTFGFLVVQIWTMNSSLMQWNILNLRFVLPTSKLHHHFYCHAFSSLHKVWLPVLLTII